MNKKFGRLTFETVKVVFHVLKARNLTLVSAELGITQPAVSFHIKKFEDIFGRKIMTRVGNNLVVSDEGNEIIEICNIVLNCGDDLQSLSDHKWGKRKQLGISPASFLAIASNADAFVDIVERYHVVDDGARALDKRYTSGELHAVFRPVGPAEPPPELSIELPFSWVASPCLQHARDDALPVILEGRGSAYAALAKHFLDKAGAPYRILAELNDFQALKTLVEAGAGYALLPDFLIGLFNAEAVADETPLSGQAMGVFGLYYRKRDISFAEATILFGQLNSLLTS